MQPTYQATKGFYIKRRDYLFGKWLRFGETGKMKLLRLAKKGAGQWEGAVHEVWQIEGKVGQFKNPLLHFSHPTVSQFLENINLYSTLRAHELYEKRQKVSLLTIITYPLVKFLKNYFWHLGFLDGLPGFLHAAFMSLHSFLVRGKLWLLWQRLKK